MPVNNFVFNPTDGLVNASTYPTKPSNEAAARQQIQDPLNQLRDFINNTLLPNLYTNSNFSATGLTGATQASRYAGATTSGAPTTGTFAKGDFVLDQGGAIWICQTAGTPGTWKNLVASNTAIAVSGGTKIQSGSIAAGGSGSYAVTFPTAFASVPIVSHAYFSNGTNISMNAPTSTAISATAVTFYSPSGAAGGTIQWIAIGP